MKRLNEMTKEEQTEVVKLAEEFRVTMFKAIGINPEEDKTIDDFYKNPVKAYALAEALGRMIPYQVGSMLIGSYFTVDEAEGYFKRIEDNFLDKFSGFLQVHAILKGAANE